MHVLGELNLYLKGNSFKDFQFLIVYWVRVVNQNTNVQEKETAASVNRKSESRRGFVSFFVSFE